MSASLLSGEWAAFLDAVDEEPPIEAVAKTALKFLKDDVAFAKPSQAVGTTLDRLEKHADWPVDLPTQAFLARVLQTLEAIAAAKRVTAASASASGGGSGAPPNLGSALHIANALAPLKTANTVELLKKIGLEDLPYAQQIDQTVVDRMWTESEAAKRESRQAFLFVDLTGKEVLPLWVPPEYVGGKADEDVDLSGDLSTSSLARLGQALNKATEGKRCFTSVAQWTATWLRYAPFAVACGHLSWSQIFIHSNSVLRIVEEEKAEGRGPFLAFVYDELVRKQIERRSIKSDPTLKITDLLQEPDRTSLVAAKQRIQQVSKSVPLHSQNEGSLTHQFVASQKRDAASAAKALASQQKNREGAGKAAGKGKSSNHSWDSWTGANSGQSSGSGGQATPRQEKRSHWYNSMTYSWQNKRDDKKRRR